MIRNTLVTIGCGMKKKTFMVAARVNEHGQAVVQQSQLDQMLDIMGVRRGQTYTVG